jgi:Cu/Ag efflux pump CusA
VQRAVATLIKGQKVGEFYEGQMVFDVAVWSEEHVRSDPSALRRLTLDAPGGGQVPLRDVADVQVVPTPNEITRENSSRKIDVTANARGRSLGAVARDVEQALAGIEFDRGYHPELLGEYTERQRSRNRMLALAVIVIAGIALILHADFQSWKLAGLVWLSLPVALLGGIAAAFASGGILSLGSLVGFVTVLGVAARNGIMLISHYRHLMESEGMKFGPELVIRGAEERLSPILMTALATGLALVPIVARGMRPGQEIEHPMAVVILGGLVTSTLLNLYVIPTLFLHYGKPRKTVAPATQRPSSLP